MNYGGAAGDPANELLAAAVLEERCGFTLSASLVVACPTLHRELPLENLASDELPPPLRAPPDALEALRAAVRTGGGRAPDDVFVAPDSYGGFGLFAAVDLPAAALIGEYVGTLSRETVHTCADAGARSATDRDAYVMRYPDVSGAVHLSARDAGSLMRFVNHAPLSCRANNCTCWALLVDGAYHTVVVTTRAVAAREELAYDYGDSYWARRGGTPGAPPEAATAGGAGDDGSRC